MNLGSLSPLPADYSGPPALRRPDYRPRLRRVYAVPLSLFLAAALGCACVTGVRAVNRLAYRVARPAVVSLDAECLGRLVSGARADLAAVAEQVLAGTCVVFQ